MNVSDATTTKGFIVLPFRLAKCWKCGREWRTKTTYRQVNCPCCGRKTEDIRDAI